MEKSEKNCTVNLTTGITTCDPAPLVCQPGEVMECNVGGDPNACACFANRFPSCEVSIRYNPNDPASPFVSDPGSGCSAGVEIALAVVLARLLAGR